MKTLLLVTKALADENRLRALWMLREHEVCVCQIVEFLELAPSTVSKHMTILKNAGLVEARKDGRWIYYRIAEQFENAEVAQVLGAVLGALAKSRTLRDGRKRLKKILRCNKEELCKKQSAS